MIYLDSAASTKIPTEVLTAIVDAYSNTYGNSSSRTHKHGTAAAELVSEARQTIAALINERSESLFFTSGATESNNIALNGLSKYFSELTYIPHVISGSTEHKSVLEPLMHLEAAGIIDLTILPPCKGGQISESDVFNCLRTNTKLITLMHVNNETGAETLVDNIAQALEGTDIFFHVDASQSFGKLNNYRLEHPRIDMISVSAHKMYGPQGIGGLFLRRRNFKMPPIEPLMRGGGQERNIRPGTLPTALCAGFGRAAQLSLESSDNWVKAVTIQKEKLLSALSGSYSVREVSESASPYILSVLIHGINSEAALIALKDKVSVSNGSACTSNSFGVSHVLESMGFSESESDSVIRFSFSPFEESLEDYLFDISNLLENSRY